jgi:hypothetical protein
MMGAVIVSAQMTETPATPHPQIQDGGAQTQTTSPADRSHLTGWFNRSGSGLFIALTPFATAVTSLVLLLLILLLILMKASSAKKNRGYFKTVAYARQRR